MYKVIPTSSFNQDLAETVLYIAEALQNPQAAASHLDLLDEVKNALAEDPYCNRTVRDTYLASQGVRSVMVKKYYVFYSIEEDSHTVLLLRFVHSRRDWARLLTRDI